MTRAETIVDRCFLAFGAAAAVAITALIIYLTVSLITGHPLQSGSSVTVTFSVSCPKGC